MKFFLGVLFIFFFGFNKEAYADTCTGGVGTYVFSPSQKQCDYDSGSRTYSCIDAGTYGIINYCVLSGGVCGINNYDAIPRSCTLSADKKTCTLGNYISEGAFLSPASGCTLCVTGACQSSDGGTFSTRPGTNLCYGTLAWTDENATDGTWNWDCKNSCTGVVQAHCSATKSSSGTTPPTGVTPGVTTAPGGCAAYNYSAAECWNHSWEGCCWDGTCTSNCPTPVPPTPAPTCTPSNGTNGVCATPPNNGSYCTWANLGSTFCSTGTVTATDTTGVDGDFNWTCNGTAGNACGTSGAPAYCSAAKKTPVTKNDGVCSAAINQKVVQELPLANTRCSSGTQTNFAGTVNYTWNCAGTDGVCPASTAAYPSCWATLDTAPTLSSTVLKNTSGTVIAVEAGGRNHSCDATFAGSKTSVWTITAADANGVADIGTISLSFRSTGNTYNTSAVSSSGGVANFTVDTTSFAPGTYSVWVLINDIHNPPGNRGWIDTNRDFKIWDCEVIVDGTLYDNSENLGCVNGSNQGFDQPIDGGLSFVFDYLDKTDGSTRDMTVVSPDFNSPKTLTWQNTYSLTNNTTSNYLGVFNRLKINDVCIVPVNTDILPRSYVDPYSASPTINIKYSAIMDQEAWYQVLNGGVFTKTNITNYVPVTCVSNCKTAIGGLIWSKDVDLSSKDSGTTATVVLKRPFYYDYEELKYDIYGGKEVGTTIATTETTVLWSQIATNKGVIFIDRDFTIDSNMDPSEPTLIVVKGDIIIEDNVTQINGMFFADGAIQASGENDTQLTITGALYSKGGVILDRSYVTKRTNNTLPAVKITYDPNLVFNLDPELWYEYNNWTLE